jgi:ABC-type nitrate/sulfonate/bicarbonate transport system substrate-binding protein
MKANELISKRKIIVLAVAILVIAIVLSSFVYLYSQSSSQGKLDNISFGDIGSDPLAALVHIAQNQNMFIKNGINLTITDCVTGPNAINSTLHNNVNLATSLEYAFVANSILKEGNQSIIASMDKANLVYIIARKDSGIQNISDLQGKKIGLSLQQSSRFYLSRFLELNGLSVQDVNLIDLQPSDWVKAFVNGTVDAFVAGESYIQLAKDQVNNTVVWAVQSDQPTYSLVFGRNDWITLHQQIVNRFLKALNQAQDYLLNHPAEAKSIIQKTYNISETKIAEVWSNYQFSLSFDQSLLLVMHDEAQWLISNNLTNATSVPNFLDYIYTNGLESVKPGAVNIIG